MSSATTLRRAIAEESHVIADLIAIASDGVALIDCRGDALLRVKPLEPSGW